VIATPAAQTIMGSLQMMAFVNTATLAVEDVEVEADVADVSVMTGTRMVIRGA